MRFIKAKSVREFCKSQGKQIKRSLLLALDVAVEQTLESACRQHNGGRRRLDDVVLNFSKKGLK